MNTFGHLFRITTWGESHGGAVGVVVDGCPPQIALDISTIQFELDRRRPGQSRLTTPRQESDVVEILSGVFEGKTLGTPISMLVWNKDARPSAYEHLKDLYRPSHADFTYQEKYGIRNWQGGGRASARETIGRVAAGAIAKQVLREVSGTETLAYVKQIHTLEAEVDADRVTLEDIEASPVRCPDPIVGPKMVERIDQARRDLDSLGGIIESVARNVPVGLGEPVFDKLKADLAKAMMSLPATMGFQIGSGFEGTAMTGSEHNDPFYMEKGGETDRIRTRTNNSGGTQGGISNGENILFQVAFKPTATIGKPQQTVDMHGNEVTLEASGRHDPCVLVRAPAIVEAMAALVLTDHLLRQRARRSRDLDHRDGVPPQRF
ncbi:chorismate synthase [Candidatus Poribacteria bacterium]|nr:chorismate synthase [Candidatus Poribacteria bacterium]